VLVLGVRRSDRRLAQRRRWPATSGSPALDGAPRCRARDRAWLQPMHGRVDPRHHLVVEIEIAPLVGRECPAAQFFTDFMPRSSRKFESPSIMSSTMRKP
jgi:hypothetical protein